jgi:hypothetical protein
MTTHGPNPQESASIAAPRCAYTRIEAAGMLGVSGATVDRLTKRGLLRPSRATRRPLYTAEEILRFLRESVADVWTGGQKGRVSP